MPGKPAARPPLIDIHQATIYRGSTRVFDALSLEIGQGERVAILGPNGAGKTTLLKLINRELYPVAAKGSWVRILGRGTWNVWQLRSHIGLVSHDLQASYRSRTTALGVVLSGFLSSVGIHGVLERRISAEERKIARRTMQDLGIGELEDTAFGSMSTGQQRRCLLARALVHDPDTLILDEPTAGLDLAASFDYLSRIRRLVAEGRSIVLVTHMLNEIPPEIERVILLRAGRIFADGPKHRVLTAENLEVTYDTPVRLAQTDGYYVAWPPAST
ncbi:MAG TPA: ATP-binding cassette domain-containing protein [Woeseiaceae bacterium]|nr:ATP-binding cassette domain-containing protein [Woeseiaceae bacterium]